MAYAGCAVIQLKVIAKAECLTQDHSSPHGPTAPAKTPHTQLWTVHLLSAHPATGTSGRLAQRSWMPASTVRVQKLLGLLKRFCSCKAIAVAEQEVLAAACVPEIQICCWERPWHASCVTETCCIELCVQQNVHHSNATARPVYLVKDAKHLSLLDDVKASAAAESHQS